MPRARGRAGIRALVALGCVMVSTACANAAPLAAQQMLDVRDLPITEVAPQSDAEHVTPTTIAVFISGDGGWADLDKSIAAELARQGVGVVGLDARSYLRRKHDADDLGRDVARLATAYLTMWHAQRVALVGYSRGADILPFAASRLPEPLRSRVTLVAMLGLAPSANFEFHWSDLVRDVSRPNDMLVLPELQKLPEVKLFCVYGTHEKNSLCRDATLPNLTKLAREGDHHFDRDYRAIADALLSAMR